MRVIVFRSSFFAALALSCALASAARAQGAAQPPQVQQPQAQQSSQQQPDERTVREPRVALSDAATAFDADGRVAVGARLRTQQLAGGPDAPVRNVSLVVENRTSLFYNYASGWATFYDAAGVRCGEGLWKVEAFAPGESAEVDTPGLRLTCAPATWRVTALNLLTRSADIAKPGEPSPAGAGTPAQASGAAQASAGAQAQPAEAQRLEININGKTLPLQLDNPVDIVIGKERVTIVVRRAP